MSQAGLASYEDEPDDDAPTSPGTTLVFGSDGRFHVVDAAEVGGESAGTSDDGPVIENLDAPPETDADGEDTITVSLVRRSGGDGDLRVREVAWIEHPQRGGEMPDGAEVRVNIRDDADYLPVSLRVDGIEPGTEDDTTLRLEVDGVELDQWTAAEGTATGEWGQWRIEDEVRLLNRIDDDDEVDLRLIIDLPEDGTSEHSVDQVQLVCLPGTWRLRSQEYLEELVRAAGGGGIEINHRSGEYRVVIRDDGTYTGFRDRWQFGFSTPQGTIVTTITSTDPGTWSSSGDQLTLVDPGSSAEITLQLDVGGELTSVPFGGTRTVGADALSGTGTYTCEEQVLTVEYQGITAIFDYVGEATPAP